MSYGNDRSWSDQFLPAIRTIVGPHLLVPSTIEADIKQATDLMVLRARDMTIAARVRRHGFADRFPYEFTVRAARDSGAKTEIEKITEGWGDWMFYGHQASPHSLSVHPWWLIDLSAWRAAMIRVAWNVGFPRVRTGMIPNGDGTHFRYFDLRTFPLDPPICVASAEPVPLVGEEE